MRIVKTTMKYEGVEMTPEDMQEALDNMHPNQRKPKKTKIRQYLSDMRAGRFPMTFDPIARDVKGRYVNGMNRLIAGIQYGKPVQFMLCTGVPEGIMECVDQGTPRSIADAARMKGMPLPHGEASYGAVARRMAIGMETHIRSISIPGVLAFIKKHEKALDFAYEVLPTNKRGICQAPTLAVIARSYYRRGARERVIEFGKILYSGLPANPEDDQAAIRVRNYLLDNIQGGRARDKGSFQDPRMVYSTVELGLHHFLNRKQLAQLRRTNEELFPIPNEYHEAEEGGE